MIRYRLVGDNDGHEYVIPVDKSDAWYAFLDSSDYDYGVEPDYAIRVDGRLTFTDPRCE